MIKFPSDGKLMKLKELLREPKPAQGQKLKIALFRERFHQTWNKCEGTGRFWRAGKASGAFFWQMVPWWVFSHLLQLPRKFVQFLPPVRLYADRTICRSWIYIMPYYDGGLLSAQYCAGQLVISNLLEFLQTPGASNAVGYKLMLLAALRMICDKMCTSIYLFSVSNEGTQPCILGAQSLVLKKLQTISPRARVAIRCIAAAIPIEIVRAAAVC